VIEPTAEAAAGQHVDPAAERHRAARERHWDGVARRWGASRGLASAYQQRLQRVYRHLVPPGQRVLELGCGSGDLLAALAPSRGVGIDLSAEMVKLARDRHRQLEIHHLDAERAAAVLAGESFDFIVLSDLVNEVWDVQALFEQVAALSHRGTRVVLNAYSRVWQLPLGLARGLGLTRPVLPQSWLTAADLQGLLRLAELRPLRRWEEVLLPLPVPLVAALCNRLLVRLWPFRHLALANFFLARPQPRPASQPLRVSVIVPARNEAGNIAAAFERTPEMGAGTELVFVEGHSSDDTYATIEREIARHPRRPARLLRQTGKGKGDAVRLGFAEASGDVLMILDADLTVPPEELPRFYRALADGVGELVNGVRLVYPMEDQAMRFANLLGNKAFSYAFTWLLGQPVKDTLCGTKVIRRDDYQRLAANRQHFGDFDPFGDFDLLFGAAKLGLEVVEVPVRYRERTYGTTNIQRWRHGLLLLRMCVFAAGRIKLV
jgi:SAM-dependent methyltransferase